MDRAQKMKNNSKMGLIETLIANKEITLIRKNLNGKWINN